MAEENNTQNDVMTVLKTPILLLVGVIVVSIYLIVMQLVPKANEFISVVSNYKTQMSAYTEKERSLEELKTKASQEQAAEQASMKGVSKPLFKPLESGLDTESIIASEFNEILGLITTNAIKTRSVKYTYDPQDDNFIKNGGSKYSVCKLDMEMIASYTNFKNFMKELYKHDHYLDIAKVEIVPYQKNKSILLINLQLKLYAEKV